MSRTTLLGVGLAVLATVLSGGWLLASERERGARLREERGALREAAEAIRGAVDEGLEGLRAREDERPFYLYNHYYSPPDVLAITDPVARSPLARPSRDPRVVGHFTIEAGDRLRTPFGESPEPEVAARVARIRAAFEGEGIAGLRARSRGGSGSAEGPAPSELVAPESAGSPVETPAAQPAEDPAADVTPETEAAATIDVPAGGPGRDRGARYGRSARNLSAEDERSARGRSARDRTARDHTARDRTARDRTARDHTARDHTAPDHPVRTEPAPDRSGRGHATGGFGADGEQVAETVVDRLGPADPAGTRRREAVAAAERPRALDNALTRLDTYSNLQAEDIARAQAGDEAANQRLVDRGRQVPRISRRNVGWDELGQDRAPSSGRRSGGAERRAPARRTRRPSVAANVAADAGALGAGSARLEGESGADPSTGPASSPGRDGAALGHLVQQEAEVTYTPMTYRDAPDALFLHRVVTLEDDALIQGVLLDREALRAAILPAVVRRHSPSGARPRIVSAGDGECAMRAPASQVLAGLELCFPPGALGAAAAALDDARWAEVSLVGLAWLAALLAALAIALAARRAEALSRQKSAFVSAVSHELRTPLTTLRMHAEMLEEGMVSEERRPKVHRELVRESHRLTRLIDNVLGLAKLDEGRRVLRLDDGDLASAVRDALTDLRPRAEERGFTLRGPDGDDELAARFDASAVEQIVANLVENAIKYARDDGAAGGERSAPEGPVIEVGVERSAGAPSLVVRDRGPGIPEAMRERVFERFVRVEREAHAHAPGTGLGLALVQDLARAHGGRASATSREGGGLEVRVELGPRRV